MTETADPLKISGFRDVDGAGNRAALIGYLDQRKANPASHARLRRKLELLTLRPGEWVLDAGCGAGTDLLAMTRLVAPGGRGVGVDLSEAMVAEARAGGGQRPAGRVPAGRPRPARFPR